MESRLWGSDFWKSCLAAQTYGLKVGARACVCVCVHLCLCLLPPPPPPPASPPPRSPAPARLPTCLPAPPSPSLHVGTSYRTCDLIAPLST